MPRVEFESRRLAGGGFAHLHELERWVAMVPSEPERIKDRIQTTYRCPEPECGKEISTDSPVEVSTSE
jgi:hypothetical protein